MFEAAKARVYLRAFVSASLAALSIAATVWIDNPYIQMSAAFFGALAIYLGIGAASPQVEPFFGRKPDAIALPGKVVYQTKTNEGAEVILKPEGAE